jgi:hypothetical protein
VEFCFWPGSLVSALNAAANKRPRSCNLCTRAGRLQRVVRDIVVEDFFFTLVDRFPVHGLFLADRQLVGPKPLPPSLRVTHAPRVTFSSANNGVARSRRFGGPSWHSEVPGSPRAAGGSSSG